MNNYRSLGALVILLALPSAAAAGELNSGDTAWMITATILVLFMTIPGLSLFYAGMVRSKNVLSVLMQCFAITSLMSILWVVYGYSLAFGGGELALGGIGLGAFIGDFDNVFMANVQADSMIGGVPESVFSTFQMTFAIITPALIVGAFAERMKFSAMLVFMAIWFTVCYVPMVHMVWSGDGALLGDWGVLDFAGGTVVHINAGVAGLAAAIIIGKRKGYPTTAMTPHNLTYSIVGAAMLWVGWFGFNAGSAIAADNVAGMAMLVTQIATATAALSWMLIEWVKYGKPSVLGIASGAVAGLVAITPAAGSVGPEGALPIGIAAGISCFFAATSMKRALGYDDSLDVFGVHAIAGIVGAILTGIFSDAAFGGSGLAEGMTIAGQLWVQTKGILFTVLYTGTFSVIILYFINRTMGLRVSEEAETGGLDLAAHDERGYSF